MKAEAYIFKCGIDYVTLQMNIFDIDKDTCTR